MFRTLLIPPQWQHVAVVPHAADIHGNIPMNDNIHQHKYDSIIVYGYIRIIFPVQFRVAVVKHNMFYFKW